MFFKLRVIAQDYYRIINKDTVDESYLRLGKEELFSSDGNKTYNADYYELVIYYFSIRMITLSALTNGMYFLFL